MALETSADAPVPVRTVLRLVSDWIGRLGRIWVEGQVTEVRKRPSTIFLTLRDPVADVSVRLMCPRAVYDAAPELADGSRVVVWAKPDFYVNRGSFTLNALEIRAVGLGELLARLERLRKLLAAEGLFAAERKRPLPFLPSTVGLICGRGSAAERDVLENARHRFPLVAFRVEEVAVQGPQAAAEVIEALRRLDADRDVEAIVVARGGGSVEDLLPFSDEGLIRAAAACMTPVVSAIGHEQDSPLLDLVADVRASTPTDAGRRVVPEVSEELARVRQLRDRARRTLSGRVEREAAAISALRTRPVLADPLREVERRQENVVALRERARRCLAARLDRGADELSHTRARLVALSPAATLQRGYAVVHREDGHVIRSAEEVAAGERLLVRFADGRVAVTVDGVPDLPGAADVPEAGIS